MPIIDVEGLTYIYAKGTPYARKALDQVSLSIDQGEFIGVVGANGSGKSTLGQHFNGLLQPTKGRVTVCGRDTSSKEYRNSLWRKVGMVFQFPEQQLFAETVAQDVAYGLKNLGLSQDEINRRVPSALEQVGLDPTAVADLSPLVLSGGMRRRVALATVLAMQLEILVLDEPTAGLDAVGREGILQIIKDLQQEMNTTVIMVSHSLRELIPLVDRLVVLNRGKVAAYGTPGEVLGCNPLQNLKGIGLPDYLRLICELKECGVQFKNPVTTFQEAEKALEKLIKESAR